LDLYAPARDNHNGRSGATHPDSRGIVFHLKARQVYGFFKPIPIKTIDGTRVYFNDVTNPDEYDAAILDPITRDLRH
jgi:hypothetical protein